MTDQLLWQVTLVAAKADVETVDDVMSDAGAHSISSFEADGGPSWRVTALFADEPAHDALVNALIAALGPETGAIDDLDIAQLEPRDWVSENLAAFPPLAAAGFWIHGSHTDAPDNDLIPIVIDAGPAFGSGEHATTEGCLIAIDTLAATTKVSRALDMGCGSGILAIAIAKRWPDAAVLGVDNDRPSVRFAREAVATNGVAEQVTIAEGDGYSAAEVDSRGPYDLIAANILLRPLVAMAADLACHLAPGGTAVLSGLLVDQADAAVAAHEKHGLVLVDRHDLRGWTALVMTRDR
ncbi:MAG: 50S ribosomal protein L11 methyltransferase [Pseudomonadota bacterium]